MMRIPITLLFILIVMSFLFSACSATGESSAFAKPRAQEVDSNSLFEDIPEHFPNSFYRLKPTNNLENVLRIGVISFSYNLPTLKTVVETLASETDYPIEVMRIPPSESLVEQFPIILIDGSWKTADDIQKYYPFLFEKPKVVIYDNQNSLEQTSSMLHIQTQLTRISEEHPFMQQPSGIVINNQAATAPRGMEVAELTQAEKTNIILIKHPILTYQSSAGLTQIQVQTFLYNVLNYYASGAFESIQLMNQIPLIFDVEKETPTTLLIKTKLNPVFQREGDVTIKASLSTINTSKKLDSISHTLPLRNESQGLELRLYIDDFTNATDYFLEYQVEHPEYIYKRQGQLSQYVGMMNVHILGQDTASPGTSLAYRVFAQDAKTGKTIHGSTVQMELYKGDTLVEQVELDSDTGDESDSKLKIPPDASGEMEVVWKVSSIHGTDTVRQPITIEPQYKMLLTTDKPIYKPNQVIHIRTIVMEPVSGTPLKNQLLTIEVEDSRGNKVFKKRLTTSEFGITSADFQLADEINMGNYKIRGILASSDGSQDASYTEEKTVQVKQYKLPKFKIDITTEENYYLPGQNLSGTISAQYTFGKPVQGDVTLELYTYDVEKNVISQINRAGLNTEGLYRFNLDLPNRFYGTDFTQGDGILFIHATIQTAADEIFEKTGNVTITQDPIKVFAFPESGTFVPEVENTFYVAASYPDSTPVGNADVQVVFPNENALSGKTDDLGIAMFSYTPSNSSVAFQATVNGPQGKIVSKEFEFNSDEAQTGILLRLDKVFSKVGDRLQIQTLTTGSDRRVFLDIIKGGQTILTKSFEETDNHAVYDLYLSPEMSGTLVLNAYQIFEDGHIKKDSKSVYVSEAEAIEIQVEPNKEVYKPGEEAQIDFTVQNTTGKPLVAALGIIVVDESVFALSEAQPGLEKVYFTLEKEIMTPSYEIHGYTPDMLVTGVVREDDRSLKAQKVLSAAMDVSIEYSIKKQTIDEKTEQNKTQLTELAQTSSKKLADELGSFLVSERKRERQSVLFNQDDPEPIIQYVISDSRLDRDDLVDTWGTPFILAHIFETGMLFLSAGPDGTFFTTDDQIVESEQAFDYWINMSVVPYFTTDPFLYASASAIRPDLIHIVQEHIREIERTVRRGMRLEDDFAVEMMMDGGAMMGGAREMPVPTAAPRTSTVSNEELSESEEAGNGKTEQPRVRRFFPETFIFIPELVTDQHGKASITRTVPDSITSWRMGVSALDQSGLFGSTTHNFTVFQEFFVDIDFPLTLTAGDEISFPIQIYNYLETSQQIRLVLEEGDWFELLDNKEKQVQMDAGEVGVAYYTIKANKIGTHAMTLYAYGSSLSDAVQRTIEVVPNGAKVEFTDSGMLDGTIEQQFTIPERAIPDASKIFVKVYPGPVAQVVEGLENMIRMPSGCFEQTSSSNYPNMLILDYMNQNNKDMPELRMKMEQYLNVGYQRLLTFEVAGGGFSWFGDAPANQMLSAYGVMEFYDMARVWEVDPKINKRTIAWILSKQNADGSWSPDPHFLHAENWGKLQNSNLLVTAYIAHALAHVKENSPALRNALAYIADHRQEAENNYARALMLLALAKGGGDQNALNQVINTLKQEAIQNEDGIHWEAGIKTMSYSYGNGADVEATSMILSGLIAAEKELGMVGNGMNWIIKQKNGNGDWGGTQANILALKTILESMRMTSNQSRGTVHIKVNGVNQTLTINADNADVLQLLDFKDATRHGANEISLRFDGEGALMYQIVGRHYEPWLQDPIVPEQAILIDLAYDKTNLEQNDTISVTVKITNQLAGTAEMVMVDLGIPPGFSVDWDGFERLVAANRIDKYESTSRQIILYLGNMDSNQVIEFNYTMKAKYPIKAMTPSSAAYPYYNPESRGESAPKYIQVERD